MESRIRLLLMLSTVAVTAAPALTQIRDVGSGAYRPSNSIGQFRGRLGSSLSSYNFQTPGYSSRAADVSTFNRPGFGGFDSGGASGVGGMPSFSSPGLPGFGPATPGYSGGGGRIAGMNLAPIASAGPATAMTDLVLLPESGDICEYDPLACDLDDPQLLMPITGPLLQQPDADASPATDSHDNQRDYSRSLLAVPTYTDTGSLVSQRTNLYIARQMAAARDLVKNRRFDQALSSYQAVINLDPQNPDPVIGTIHCFLMTGSYKAAGLAVLRLARVQNSFWTKPPDYYLVFGIDRTRILDDLDSIQDDLDLYIGTYGDIGGSEGHTRSHGMLSWLGVLYIGWINNDEQAVKDAVSRAANAGPFHTEVQELYRQITGDQSRQVVSVEDLTPVGTLPDFLQPRSPANQP